MQGLIFFIILAAVLGPELKKRAQGKGGARKSGARPNPAVYLPPRGGAGAAQDAATNRRILTGGAVGVGCAVLAGLMGLVGISVAGSDAWMLGMGLDYLVEYIAGVGVYGLLAAGFWMGSRQGFRLLDRAKRCRLYQTLIGTREKVPLRELAMGSAQSEEALEKDLTDMIRRGYFPHAMVDGASGCYYADSAAWAGQDGADAPQAAPAGPAGEVRQFIQELDAEAEHIDDAPVRARLDAIRARAAAILDWLDTHPEAGDDVRRFASYYLPTTLKLVRSYNDVDPHAGQSGAAARVQAQVAQVLETVEQAFASLLDNLIGHEAVDVSAEISALETVLAQDGLSPDGLRGTPAGARRK